MEYSFTYSVVLLLSLLSNCTFDTTSNIFNNIVNVNQYVGVYIRRIATTYVIWYMLIHHAKCPSPHANLSSPMILHKYPILFMHVHVMFSIFVFSP